MRRADGQTGRRADGQTGRRAGVVKLVVMIVAGASIVTSYWWGPSILRRMDFFAVRRVEVRGTRYLAPRDVIRRMALAARASVFDDLDAIERRITSQSGIERARVSRRLPGTLVVEVGEVEPVALAEGPGGLIPLAADATPLPYDLQVAPVDVPVVQNAEPVLVKALATVQAADANLFRDVGSARSGRGEVVLELPQGRVRLATPVDPDKVQVVSMVRADIAGHGGNWQELDGRFQKWVVVRTAHAAEPVARPVAKSPSRQVSPRRPVRRGTRRAR